MVLVLWAMTALFTSCDFGQKLIDQFELFEMKMYRCKWYLLPIKMQRIFAIAMMNVQQSTAVQSFGYIELSRETSRMVGKWIYDWIINNGFQILHSYLIENVIFSFCTHVRDSMLDFLFLWLFDSSKLVYLNDFYSIKLNGQNSKEKKNNFIYEICVWFSSNASFLAHPKPKINIMPINVSLICQ